MTNQLFRTDDLEIEFRELLDRFDNHLQVADLDGAYEVLAALERNVEQRRSERKMHILHITQKRFNKAEGAG